MSYDTERYGFEKLSNQNLSIIECGLQMCHSGHSSVKMLYPDYSIHFILEGKGRYITEDKEYELGKGQGFLITPDVPNVYIADEIEPWKYIYATFKGIDAESIVRNCGLSSNNVVFSFIPDEGMMSDLKNMHEAGKDRSAKGYDALGYFFLVMSRLVRDAGENKKASEKPYDYVSAALAYIDDYSTHNISVNDIAAYVKIDRTYLYSLFKKYFGVSPSKYLTEVRLKRAVSLMEYKRLSLNEIAISSGFYDLSHFSRFFINTYGMTPGKYREINFSTKE